MSDNTEIFLPVRLFIERLQLGDYLTERDELKCIVTENKAGEIFRILLYFEDRVQTEIRRNMGKTYGATKLPPHKVIVITDDD